MADKLKITLVKSTIGAIPKHKKTVEALGLRKLNKTVEMPDNAAVRGMVNQVKHLVTLQAEILDKACQFVSVGGKLHYMTCSLLEVENQSQMRSFLKRHPDFRLIHHQQWTPATTHTDGFFLASFERVKDGKN